MPKPANAAVAAAGLDAGTSPRALERSLPNAPKIDAVFSPGAALADGSAAFVSAVAAGFMSPVAALPPSAGFAAAGARAEPNTDVAGAGTGLGAEKVPVEAAGADENDVTGGAAEEGADEVAVAGAETAIVAADLAALPPAFEAGAALARSFLTCVARPKPALSVTA